MNSVQTETSTMVTLLVEHPCPGVARAMIGPILPPGCETVGSTTRCLAVSQDGSFAACWEIDVGSFHVNPSTFWVHASLSLSEAKSRPIPSGARLSPPDCVKVLSSASFWLPHPTWALHPAVGALSSLIAAEQFGTGELSFADKFACDLRAQTEADGAVNLGSTWVLNALRPEILSVTALRPRISILLVQRILALAETYGQKAVAYSLQALATEAIGFLNLIASGHPEEEARILRGALFAGASLPTVFSSAIGATRSAHRHSLKPLVFRNMDLVPDPPRRLNELPLSGQTFLTTMRLQRFFPLHGRQDFENFSRMVEVFSHLELQDAIIEDMFYWCLKRGGYSGGTDLLQNLMKRARTMVRLMRNLAHHNITIETAISEILEAKKTDNDPDGGFDFAESASRGFAQVLRFLAKVSGKTIGTIVRPMFGAHPGIPQIFTSLRFKFEILALDEIEAAMTHGEASDNCLKVLAGIKPYLLKGWALYAVRAENTPVGTIALGFNGVDTVQVQEVRGHANAGASSDLVGVAEDLARSFTSTGDLFRWRVYEESCKDWFRAYSA